MRHYETLPSDDRDVVIEGELLREQGLFDLALKRMEYAILCGSSRATAIQREAIGRKTAVCIVRESSDVIVY